MAYSRLPAASSFSAVALDGPSSYTVSVQAADSGNLLATTQTTIQVVNTAPSATFATTSGAIDEGGAVTLVFSNPFDPGLNDQAAGFFYSYDCPQDGLFELSNAAVSSYTCSYPNDGIFTVEGQIADKDGDFSSYTAQVTVNNAAPSVNAGADAVIFSGQVFNLNAAFTDPGVEDTHTATIDFGAGQGYQPAAVQEEVGSGTVRDRSILHATNVPDAV